MCRDSGGRARHHRHRRSGARAARPGRAAGDPLPQARPPHRPARRLSLGRAVPARRSRHRGHHAAVAAVPHRQAPARWACRGARSSAAASSSTRSNSTAGTWWSRCCPTARTASSSCRERNGPRSAWTTTLQYVRARNGETTYRDYGTPWSVVTRNLDITVARTDNRYVGRASFRGGTVAIQSYVPFDLDMASRFTIERGAAAVRPHRPAHRAARRRGCVGDASLAHWPEQMYRMQSTVDFPWMRKIFFANESFELSGKGDVPRHVPPVSRSRARRPQPHRPRAEGHVHEPGRRPEHAALRRPEGRGEVGAGVGGGHRHHDVVLRRHDAAGLHDGAARRSRACSATYSLRGRLRGRGPADVHELPRDPGAAPGGPGVGTHRAGLAARPLRRSRRRRAIAGDRARRRADA